MFCIKFILRPSHFDLDGDEADDESEERDSSSIEDVRRSRVEKIRHYRILLRSAKQRQQTPESSSPIVQSPVESPRSEV